MTVTLYANKKEQLIYFGNAIKKRMVLKLARERCTYQCFDTIYIQELKEYRTFVCPLMYGNDMTKRTNNCWPIFSKKEIVIQRFLEYFTEAELFEELL